LLAFSVVEFVFFYIILAKLIAMNTQQILQASYLDLLFDGRNKLYGAYELRKHYQKRGTIALVIAAVLSAIFVTCILLYYKSQTPANVPLIGPIIELVDLPPVKEKELEKETPKEKEIIKKPQFATIKSVTPIIVPDNMVVDSVAVPQLTDLDNAVISNATISGASLGNNTVVANSAGSADSATVGGEDNTEFLPIQKEATFPGGIEAWKKFLERNLNRDLPVDNGAPEGLYSVTVSFVVNAEGKVSDIVIEKDAGYGTGAEAARVIKKSAIWIPALQNNKQVVYRQKQTIVFKVNEG